MPARKPLIGLTTYARNEKDAFSLPAPYLAAVRRAGGIPFLIAPDETELDAIVQLLSGLILTGGGDLDPKLYEGRDHETVYMVDHERDNGEIAILKLFLEAEKPVLGICRGMQVINVALGGSLLDHVPDHFGEKVIHRMPPREPTPHKVSIDSNSRLASLLGTAECEISSWHHQALERVATELRVVGHAPDGLVEAVEWNEYPWLYAVQWHPELTAATDPVQQRLFDALVEYITQPEQET